MARMILLTEGQAAEAVEALNDAVAYRDPVGADCTMCEQIEDLCPDHQSDLEICKRYASLREAISWQK